MITLNCLAHLEPFGIVPLTGEACGLSYRILCDLTKKGKATVEKALGVAITSENWNRGSEGNPHVASIMLTHHMLTPLAAFALLDGGYAEVDIVRPEDSVYESVIGYDLSEIDKQNIIDFRMSYKTYHYEFIRTLRYAGTAGDRNIHVMSGRIS